MCWSFLPHVRFLILLTVFELLPKTCNFTICSIFSNSGHVGWCTASPDTILKLDTLVMIQTKFGFHWHWSSTFRGEDFWKSLRRTTDDDDGRQVMGIAHMTLGSGELIKDEVLLTVSSPIFPSILIAKNLLTGSLKNRSIDNLETQKKSISMKNSQFFDYLLYAKSK